jgi:hypothetical protein
MNNFQEIFKQIVFIGKEFTENIKNLHAVGLVDDFAYTDLIDHSV